MRIELPLPSWADTTLHVDDDAHTLTVAASPLDWAPWQWGSDPVPSTLRLQVDVALAAAQTLTITF
jgi:hypothetical protein